MTDEIPEKLSTAPKEPEPVLVPAKEAEGTRVPAGVCAMEIDAIGNLVPPSHLPGRGSCGTEPKR